MQRVMRKAKKSPYPVVYALYACMANAWALPARACATTCAGLALL